MMNDVGMWAAVYSTLLVAFRYSVYLLCYRRYSVYLLYWYKSTNTDAGALWVCGVLDASRGLQHAVHRHIGYATIEISSLD